MKDTNEANDTTRPDIVMPRSTFGQLLAVLRAYRVDAAYVESETSDDPVMKSLYVEDLLDKLTDQLLSGEVTTR